MKKTNITITVGLAIVIGIVFYALKNNPSEAQEALGKNSKSIETVQRKSADKVQVFLFHSTQRCTTCIAIGKLAGETVNEFFQSELRDGKIEFREINIDLPENKELAQKFKATGSALYLNAISAGADNISQDTKVWQLTSNETQFKSYLKDKINNYFGK
ncbi:MAG: nitrophenyl compound nitroreductase subunit ArsF family protein [Candidatus Moranbacteria bacterium]|nr:nitrophenyl compound nitroreductase subunit ArsF family protein [Candidatus Moranbacteria bacterium]